MSEKFNIFLSLINIKRLRVESFRESARNLFFLFDAPAGARVKSRHYDRLFKNILLFFFKLFNQKRFDGTRKNTSFKLFGILLNTAKLLKRMIEN